MHVGIPGKCPTCLKAISQVKSERGRITSLLMLGEEVKVSPLLLSLLLLLLKR